MSRDQLAAIAKMWLDDFGGLGWEDTYDDEGLNMLDHLTNLLVVIHGLGVGSGEP